KLVQKSKLFSSVRRGIDLLVHVGEYHNVISASVEMRRFMTVQQKRQQSSQPAANNSTNSTIEQYQRTVVA
ncbi:unnamed protein product, partial [Ceratitis capitata]